MDQGACRCSERKAEGVEDRFVTNNLGTLLTALYVDLDDRVLPALGWSRDHRPGRKPALSDAELACLAAAQHLLGIGSERRWIRYAHAHLAGMFASDITDHSRQMFVAKANGHVIAYGRVAELAAGEAAPGTPAGCYLSGVLVDPAWRRRGIATALTRARLRWVFARTGEAFYVAGADNMASLHLHAALGFQETKRFGSERSAAGVDVLSRLTRAAASPDVRPSTGGE